MLDSGQAIQGAAGKFENLLEHFGIQPMWLSLCFDGAKVTTVEPRKG